MHDCGLTARPLTVSVYAQWDHTVIVKGLSMLLLKTHLLKELCFQELKILCALWENNFSLKSCLQKNKGANIIWCFNTKSM